MGNTLPVTYTPPQASSSNSVTVEESARGTSLPGAREQRRDSLDWTPGEIDHFLSGVVRLTPDFACPLCVVKIAPRQMESSWSQRRPSNFTIDLASSDNHAMFYLDPNSEDGSVYCRRCDCRFYSLVQDKWVAGPKTGSSAGVCLSIADVLAGQEDGSISWSFPEQGYLSKVSDGVDCGR
ncbi:hypothetical protein M427DRAFT_157399 [Gonapodya prolifera JEL478]|uniref:Uncharacterized protein n=1 Tax=Gonapodya prolifera (strain JEL478) TaxID=1344416 RepID=A0A139A698_GONPJ|nr:hypothetical protein M427DRAFT_157399 [Gonapodya prolifera JEL478]|eukprot:KXS12281.1 hypothetical protein M427DRAFT_157399 [Gonapodya prolifera JEL478]